MNPTSEQLHIRGLVTNSSSNILIRAFAGTGKTSTLEMLQHHEKEKPALYLVFNKRNAVEAEERMLSTTAVKTFNSMGHRIWASACAKKRLALDAKKSQEILRNLINEVKDKHTKSEMWDSFWDIVSGVAMAKALGYIPEGKFQHAKRLITQGEFHGALEEKPDDLTSDLIDAVLTTSIKQAYDGLIDFNDQIYMPALFGGTFPRFPLVKVDESQDLSPVNHAMLDKLVKGRLIAVGDECQNIYGFRGAKQGGMRELQEKYKMSVSELSVSFRCPSAIVEAARWRVPQFKFIKEGGHYEVLSQLLVDDINDSSTFICRNNAPLFKVAIHLIMAGRGVTVAGSDIGPKLIGIMKRLGAENLPKESVLFAIDDWLAQKQAKESKTANDLADCMRVFANVGANLGQAIAYAEHLFKQAGKIQLLTGHKAKGLEFDTVYHLDPWLCREDEQDQNLRYVITTRSKDRLFEVNSNQIQWP